MKMNMTMERKIDMKARQAKEQNKCPFCDKLRDKVNEATTNDKSCRAWRKCPLCGKISEIKLHAVITVVGNGTSARYITM